MLHLSTPLSGPLLRSTRLLLCLQKKEEPKKRSSPGQTQALTEGWETPQHHADPVSSKGAPQSRAQHSSSSPCPSPAVSQSLLPLPCPAAIIPPCPPGSIFSPRVLSTSSCRAPSPAAGKRQFGYDLYRGFRKHSHRSSILKPVQESPRTVISITAANCFKSCPGLAVRGQQGSSGRHRCYAKAARRKEIYREQKLSS